MSNNVGIRMPLPSLPTFTPKQTVLIWLYKVYVVVIKKHKGFCAKSPESRRSFKDADPKFSTHFALLDFPVSQLYNGRLTNLCPVCKSCVAAGEHGMSLNGGMSNLSSCSSGSCPYHTCSPVLLASKGLEKNRIVAVQADRIRDAFYYFSYIHTKQLFLWERLKSSCCLLQTMCGFLILANPG